MWWFRDIPDDLRLPIPLFVFVCRGGVGQDKNEKRVHTGDQHIENIEALTPTLSADWLKPILKEVRFRVGVAQKAFNLYLKFLWCLEWILEPPHCPVDNVVLSAIGNKTRWTKMNGIDSYKDIIAQIREHIQNSGTGESLAQWELELWNEYRRKQMSNNGV